MKLEDHRKKPDTICLTEYVDWNQNCIMEIKIKYMKMGTEFGGQYVFKPVTVIPWTLPNTLEHWI